MPVSARFFDELRNHGIVVLNWRSPATKDIVAYAVAYRNAAHRLVAAVEAAVGYPDHVAFPIVFLFRHSVELFLKALAFHAAQTVMAEAELKVALPRLWREHSLPKLVAMAEAALRHLEPSPPSGVGVALPAAEPFIEQLSELDPGSYAFRYPVGTDGASVFANTVKMNVLVFAEAADGALDELASACIYMERRFSASIEARAALQSLLQQ